MAVVDRDGEPVVLELGAGDVRELARQVGEALLEHGAEVVPHLAVDRPRLGALDVEPVAAGVHEAVELHEAVHLLGRATRDDGRHELGRQVVQRRAHGLRHERLVRHVHDRRERAVIVEEHHRLLAWVHTTRWSVAVASLTWLGWQSDCVHRHSPATCWRMASMSSKTFVGCSMSSRLATWHTAAIADRRGSRTASNGWPRVLRATRRGAKKNSSLVPQCVPLH